VIQVRKSYLWCYSFKST